MNIRNLLLKNGTGKVLAAGIVIGILLAVGIRGAYDLTGDSKFCGSCHSMREVYLRWQLSRHKKFACVDCHLPHGIAIGAVAYKMRAGINDLLHETLRDYPASFSFSRKARAIANDNCVRCHYSTIEKTAMAQEEAECLKCHRGLVHGRTPAKGGIPRE